MEVTKSVNERARLQVADLGHHQRQQRVAGDVEGHPQEDVRTALVKLAAQFTFAHVELKETMTRRQRHAVNVRHVPGADDQAATVGFLLNLLDDLANLVNAPLALAQTRSQWSHRNALRDFPKVEFGLAGSGFRSFDRSALGLHPVSPLLSIHRAQVSLLIGPFVPDGHLVLLQVTNVSFAPKKP